MPQPWEPSTASLFEYEQIRRRIPTMTRGDLEKALQLALHDAIVVKPAVIHSLMRQQLGAPPTVKPSDVRGVVPVAQPDRN